MPRRLLYGVSVIFIIEVRVTHEPNELGKLNMCGKYSICD